MVITIDGPVASGKSSVACLVAKNLQYTYLSSGLLYRALAYVLVHEYGYSAHELSYGLKQDDIEAILKNLDYCYTSECGSVLYKGRDITSYLKSAACDDWSSRISQHENVRAYSMDFQRRFAQNADCIVEGRDCGSIVFPYARCKFFITASLDERARRWQSMQHKRGEDFSFEYCRRYVQERDSRDMTRKIAPLIKPEDAVVIDTTTMSLDAVVQKIETIVLGCCVD